MPDWIPGLQLKADGYERGFRAKRHSVLIRCVNAATVQFGTVVWPGDIDISPDTLYLKRKR